MTILIGVDLSLFETGVALWSQARGMSVYSIKTRPPSDPERWHVIVQDIMKSIKDYRTSVAEDVVAVVEGPIYNSPSRSVLELAYVRAVLLYRFYLDGGILTIDGFDPSVSRLGYVKECSGVSPSKLKLYISGNGKATKQRVMANVRNILNVSVDNHNEADAVALLAMAMDRYGVALAKLPDIQRKALEGLHWPEIQVDN